ncbi:hypothetical protein [Azospirillum sp. sgz301742]
MAEDPIPLSLLEALARYGWPSEMLGPVPRAGGLGCARVAAGLGCWRVWADQADDIAAARAATDDSGNAADLKRVLARIDREIAELELHAFRDVERSGAVEPWRLARIDALRARRQNVRMLAAAGFTPPI